MAKQFGTTADARHGAAGQGGGDALISVRDCRVQDARRTYIPRLSWQMNAGEAWLVIGASNSGKDMFLRALVGNLPELGRESLFTMPESQKYHILDSACKMKLMSWSWTLSRIRLISSHICGKLISDYQYVFEAIEFVICYRDSATENHVF